MTELKDYTTDLACALNGYRALIIPDLHNADSHHWLSLWENKIPGARRILMHDWHSPNWVKWRNSIIASLIVIDQPVVIIAEGFGALAAASVADEYPGKIIAALLVDPANPDEFDLRKKIPKQPLTIPISIAIRQSSQAVASQLAALWSADLVQPTNTSGAEPSNVFWAEGIQALSGLVSHTQRRVNNTNQARSKKIMAYLREIKQANSLKQLGYQPS